MAAEQTGGVSPLIHRSAPAKAWQGMAGQLAWGQLAWAQLAWGQLAWGTAGMRTAGVGDSWHGDNWRGYGGVGAPVGVWDAVGQVSEGSNSKVASVRKSIEKARLPHMQLAAHRTHGAAAPDLQPQRRRVTLCHSRRH